ncbi:MAG: DsbA family oxidoreductase [Actinomycetota bacterium]|nr:DsbA family oxidoreductase [Actinomycetota bacterium]
MAVAVDIWTDINCPFCYLGKRRFEMALADFAHRDEVTVVHRSFELDPTIPAGASGSVEEHIAQKYGIPVEQARANERGIAAQAAEIDLPYVPAGRDYGNSFDMHRLLHLGAAQGKQGDVLDALYAGNFADPAPVFGDRERIVDIAVTAGLDEASVRATLDDPEAHADAVRRDEQQARELGVTGVPFFVFGGKYAVSGAQPSETFARALQLAWDEQPVTIVGDADAACGSDGCAVPTTD